MEIGLCVWEVVIYDVMWLMMWLEWVFSRSPLKMRNLRHLRVLP